MPKWFTKGILNLLTLITVLVWCGILFDKIMEKPFCSIILVLGTLIIIYGGEIAYGNLIKIKKK